MVGESISFTAKNGGAFPKTRAKLEKYVRGDIFATLDHFGAEGASALAAVTPVATGQAANSWSYEVRKTATSYEIVWRNSDMAGPTPVVILLQYGHGTGTGGYVQGRDFINPVIKPLFERIREDVRKAVRSA
jgi:hypothetical protein